MNRLPRGRAQPHTYVLGDAEFWTLTESYLSHSDWIMTITGLIGILLFIEDKNRI
jgi:hypothetical protein